MAAHGRVTLATDTHEEIREWAQSLLGHPNGAKIRAQGR